MLEIWSDVKCLAVNKAYATRGSIYSTDKGVQKFKKDISIRKTDTCKNEAKNCQITTFIRVTYFQGKKYNKAQKHNQNIYIPFKRIF